MIKDIGFSFLLKSLSMGLMKRMGFNYEKSLDNLTENLVIKRRQ
jgi:hypothetical protein